MHDLTRDTLISAARQAAEESGAPFLSRSDFVRLTGISDYHVYRLFPDGGWTEVVKLAGLDRNPRHNNPLTDDELLSAFHVVVTELHRIPSWAQLNSRAAVAADTIRKRFGGMSGTIERYQNWLTQNDLESSVLEKLEVRSVRHSAPIHALDPASGPLASKAWTKREGITYGAPIAFRGLRHAPINEQGVVFLFGMVSHDLGLQVEAIQSGFPDCVAKRAVDRKGDRWQQVRIEFEFASSNFVDHGHDPSGCDMVVCWSHDWAGCPLEIIELRSVITQLKH